MPSFDDRLRKREYFVDDVRYVRLAKQLIERHHYAKGCSHAGVYWHGLFDDCGFLVGVAQWLPPTRPAAESVAGERWREVLSLSRLCVLPDVPKNACTYIIANSIKRIRKEGRFSVLLTYADQSQGHTGLIYKAAGWIKLSLTKPTRRWIDPATGRQVSVLATKSRTKEQMLELGYVQTEPRKMSKWVYFVDKREHQRYGEL